MPGKAYQSSISTTKIQAINKSLTVSLFWKISQKFAKTNEAPDNASWYAYKKNISISSHKNSATKTVKLENLTKNILDLAYEMHKGT